MCTPTTTRPLVLSILNLLLVLGLAAAAPLASAQDTLRVYSPGGPAPAMEAAADAFSAAHGVPVRVSAGPASRWMPQARRDADVVYSGSEHMMTDFTVALRDAGLSALDTTTVTPLYLRPAAIVVRAGNPEAIAGFHDLLRPDLRVLVVQGAGQTGLWEDVAGREGDIEEVRAFRRNVGAFAPNTGAALRTWQDDESFDAWLVYGIWYAAHPGAGELMAVEPEHAVYRDTGVALTRRGAASTVARDFAAFLRSPESARIFASFGWRVFH